MKIKTRDAKAPAAAFVPPAQSFMKAIEEAAVAVVQGATTDDVIQKLMETQFPNLDIAAVTEQINSRVVELKAEAEKAAIAAGSKGAEAARETVAARIAGSDAAQPSAEDVEMVTVVIPKAFKLRLGHTIVLDFTPGVRDVPRHVAEHGYAIANGMKIYIPEAKTEDNAKQ